MHPYSINVAWSEEDEAFIATCPEFPGLSAFGETRDEAIREAEVALEGLIEVLLEDGQDLPAPELVRTFSGRFLTRLPKSLHARLSSEAEREGVSLNSLVQMFLTECVTSMEVFRRRERALDKRLEEFAEQVRQDLKLGLEASATEFQDSDPRVQMLIQESKNMYA